jgi:hypothetical protein
MNAEITNFIASRSYMHSKCSGHVLRELFDRTAGEKVLWMVWR